MKRIILNSVFCLLILVSYGQISSISSGETGSSVRSKLNAVIDSINNNEIMTLVRTNGNFIVGNGSNWQVESGSTARASLGLTLGSDVQAYDADLAIYAGITPSANIQTLLQSANFLTARNNLELGVSDEVEFNKLTIDTLTNNSGGGRMVWGDIVLQGTYISTTNDTAFPPVQPYIEMAPTAIDMSAPSAGFIQIAAGNIDINAFSGELDVETSEYIDVLADSLDMGSSKITNLGTPVNNSDATNKSYVDTQVASTGNVSTSGTPVANDFARFTDASTIEGRSYSETRADLSLSTTDNVEFGQLIVDDILINSASITNPSGNMQIESVSFNATAISSVSSIGNSFGGILIDGAVLVSGSSITGLSDPSASDGAATKNYVDNLFISNTSVLDFASTSAQNSSDLTITATGAVVGDVVILGVPNGSVNSNSSFSAWVSASNTVTVRFNNYSSGAIDPVSGTFKVTVIPN